MNADPDPTPPERESTSDAGSDAATAPDIAALRAELVAHKERYLRLAADFDNFRKRTTQETERRAAAQKAAFIRQLLPVIANLERALGAEASSSTEQLRQGVQITLQQLYQLLRRHAIEPEESLGRPFDPHRHEAVMIRHDPSQPDHIVLETLERGYRRGDEIFRSAKVVVNDLSTPESSRALVE